MLIICSGRLVPTGASTERAVALGEIQSSDIASMAIIGLLQAAAGLSESDNSNTFEILESLENTGLSTAYVQLANFKKLLLEDSGLSAEARVSELEAMSLSASPYRLFAKEQVALIELASGNQEEAINRLSEIFEDASASNSLRQRVSQLMTILGEAPTQSEK